MPRSTAILHSCSELRRRTRALSNNTFSTTLCGLHPLVDVAPLFCVGSPSRRETVQAIGAAMGERGYFYCENVDILPAEYIRSVYQFSQRMHALPVEVKKAFSQRGSGSYTGADIGEHEIEYEVGVKASACSWDYSPGKVNDDGDLRSRADRVGANSRRCPILSSHLALSHLGILEKISFSQRLNRFSQSCMLGRIRWPKLFLAHLKRRSACRVRPSSTCFSTITWARFG